MGNRLPLSILDLAIVQRGQPIAEALHHTTELAVAAEATGRFERLWFAEHHNMAAIASAATPVLLAHIAAHTSTIRIGSGGVMLPNHSPLVIAEAFGTLAELHPGRVDLGLGRAPGTDQTTWRALRRDPRASDRFPDDVRELQAYLADRSIVPGVKAIPGRGTNVPLYILGSSLFGAQLAAAFGLPYAFASHFAPDALVAAVQAYRQQFVPSEQLDHPHVIAAVNVIVADDHSDAQAMADHVLRARVRMLAGRVPGVDLSKEGIESLLDGPIGAQARHMMTYTAVGDPGQVEDYLRAFRAHADADEVIVTNSAPDFEARRRALDLLAELDAA